MRKNHAEDGNLEWSMNGSWSLDDPTISTPYVDTTPRPLSWYVRSFFTARLVHGSRLSLEFLARSSLRASNSAAGINKTTRLVCRIHPLTSQQRKDRYPELTICPTLADVTDSLQAGIPQSQCPDLRGSYGASLSQSASRRS